MRWYLYFSFVEYELDGYSLFSLQMMSLMIALRGIICSKDWRSTSSALEPPEPSLGQLLAAWTIVVGKIIAVQCNYTLLRLFCDMNLYLRCRVTRWIIGCLRSGLSLFSAVTVTSLNNIIDIDDNYLILSFSSKGKALPLRLQTSTFDKRLFALTSNSSSTTPESIRQSPRWEALGLSGDHLTVSMALTVPSTIAIHW